MKHIIQKSFIIAMIIAAGCGETTGPDPLFKCPPPEEGWDGLKNIPGAHMYQKLSPDGKKLAYTRTHSSLRVLNLKTGIVREIDIRSKMPSNVLIIGVDHPYWCPYNSNRLLVHCATSTDTVGDGKRYVYGQNLYILSLDGSEFKRVTPSILGPAGAKISLSILGWLPESSIDRDLIHIAYPNKKGEGTQNIYIPQDDDFIECKYKSPYAISKDGNLYFTRKFAEDNKSIIYYINNEVLYFKEKLLLLDKASWSPNSKYLALSVAPYQPNVSAEEKRYMEVWILDIEKYMKNKQATVPVKIINLRRNYCMYAFMGIHVEFISGSTLAVSMHKDGDEFSFLWEITDKGEIVRQLTFEP